MSERYFKFGEGERALIVLALREGRFCFDWGADRFLIAEEPQAQSFIDWLIRVQDLPPLAPSVPHNDQGGEG